MNWLWLGLMMSTGFLVALQAPVNSRLRIVVGSPMLSAVVSFGGGLLLLVAMAAAGMLGGWGRGWSGLRDAPWWAFTGGVYGAFSVLAAIVALPRLGAGLTVACSVAGWQLGALLVDTFGWFGVQRVPVSGGRIGGAALILAGVWLLQRR